MKNILFFVSLTLFSNGLYSQVFDATLKQYAETFVPDRLHIHFDKNTYGAGDTIWFKAYALNALTPVTESKNLYIDWTDGTGKLIERTVSPLLSGVTMGQVPIPAGYNSAFIHAKAYTKWMLNFDTAMLFNKDIRVLSDNTTGEKAPAAQFKAFFFPEGGNLIANVINKVAFKLADQFGRPLDADGTLTVDGKPTDKIKTLHDGMGYFLLRPEAGKKYSVTWTSKKFPSQSTDLPSAISTGVAMQIGWMPGKRSFMISGGGTLATQKLRVIGSMFGQPVFDIVRTPESGIIQGVVPVDNLPSGVLRFTVLDEQYHPIAERITFVNNRDYDFNSEMEVMHWGLNKRARNEIEISIPDSLSANLSVSVTDGQLDIDTSSGIISDLLLTSEIKGNVHNPSFYFKDNSDSTEQLLDLVMLTNGWRKISWTDIANGKLPEIKYPKDSTYLTISGNVYGATPAQLQEAGDLILIVNQKKNSEWLMTPVSGNGSFAVKDYLLFDTALVYYQVPKGKGMSNASVQFKENPLPVATGRIPAGLGKLGNVDTTGYYRQFMLSKALQAELDLFKGKVLNEIKITAKTKSPEQVMDEKYTSGLFAGGGNTSFNLLTDPSVFGSRDIFSYLQGKVAGVMITTGTPPSITWRSGTPALFLNEMPVDAETLTNIPVSDIAYVKVLNPPFVGAVGGGANGAIAIYTRKGNDVQFESGKGLARNTVTGYSILRQFYSPDYEKAPSDKKDLRTTLYWNPEVILSPGKNKIVLKFFNNDVSESFRVIIEGMTPDGKLTRLVKVME